MGTTPWKLIRRDLGPEAEARIDRRKAEMGVTVVAHSVAELRRQRARTQAQIAQRLGIDPSTQARNERNADPRLSTVRQAVEALGGRLEIVAVFDDALVRLDILAPEAETSAPAAAAGSNLQGTSEPT